MALIYNGQKVPLFFNWKEDYRAKLTDFRMELNSLAEREGSDSDSYRVLSNAQNILDDLIKKAYRFSKEQHIYVFENLAKLVKEITAAKGEQVAYIIKNYTAFMINFISTMFRTTGTIEIDKAAFATEYKNAVNASKFEFLSVALKKAVDEFTSIEDEVNRLEAELNRIFNETVLHQNEPNYLVALKRREEQTDQELKKARADLKNAKRIVKNAKEAFDKVSAYMDTSESVLKSNAILDAMEVVIDIEEYKQLFESYDRKKLNAKYLGDQMVVIEKMFDDDDLDETPSTQQASHTSTSQIYPDSYVR